MPLQGDTRKYSCNIKELQNDDQAAQNPIDP
jgi:hypothetical protein